MSIIFSEKGLADCNTPCVAQKFVNHNAVLYKIFIVGDSHYFVDRPSLKNFHECNLETIYFESSNVSKAGSQSSLSILDPEDKDMVVRQPDPEKMKLIAETLRDAFEMDLLGVDVVIENSSGKYAIIDINAYPGEFKVWMLIQGIKLPIEALIIIDYYSYSCNVLTFYVSQSAFSSCNDFERPSR